MHAQIAGRLTGPVTKWIVLAFWLVAVGTMAGFAQKLTDVQNNEASSWLPESAESTKAIDQLEPFQDTDTIPTVVDWLIRSPRSHHVGLSVGARASRPRLTRVQQSLSGLALPSVAVPDRTATAACRAVRRCFSVICAASRACASIVALVGTPLHASR